jgi:hypothetical protein
MTICAMSTESEIAQRTRGERLLISLDSMRALMHTAVYRVVFEVALTLVAVCIGFWKLAVKDFATFRERRKRLVDRNRQ